MLGVVFTTTGKRQISKLTPKNQMNETTQTLVIEIFGNLLSNAYKNTSGNPSEAS